MRVKFSPSDVVPCGTRLDVSDDILKGSELTLPIADVEHVDKVLPDRKCTEEVEGEEMEVAISKNEDDEKNESKRVVRNSNVVNPDSSNVEKLVSPV